MIFVFIKCPPGQAYFRFGFGRMLDTSWTALASLIRTRTLQQHADGGKRNGNAHFAARLGLNWIELNWIIQCIYVVCSVVCEIHWTVAVCSLLQSIDRIIICPMPDPRKKKKETGKTRERSATTHDFTLFSWCLVRLGAEETADAGAALSVGINMKLYKNIIHTRL